jgi:hypothetical protein
MTELIYRELSRDIIGAATTVRNDRKPGLDEKLCQNALVIELCSQGHDTEQQASVRITHSCDGSSAPVLAATPCPGKPSSSLCPGRSRRLPAGLPGTGESQAGFGCPSLRGPANLSAWFAVCARRRGRGKPPGWTARGNAAQAVNQALGFDAKYGLPPTILPAHPQPCRPQCQVRLRLCCAVQSAVRTPLP